MSGRACAVQRAPPARENGHMLFLLSGSSGSGKSTLLEAIAGRVEDLALEELWCAAPEGYDDRQWRRHRTEEAVRRAAAGGDLLVTEGVFGDVLAAPSATRLDGIAACLLDCDDRERVRRVLARDPSLHQSQKAVWDFCVWAAWLRHHARDPQWFAGPLRGDGDRTMRWERWERWREGDPRWTVFVLDTTRAPVDETADQLVAWIEEQRALLRRGELPLSGRWWD